MRWVFNALPWDELERLAMVTLTYPGDWRSCCPNGRTLKRHLRAFRERWRRRWGAPRGTWVIEFQPRVDRPVAQQLAPHIHLYVELPDGAVLESDLTDGRLVWDWARRVWWEIVGSGNGKHRYWGAHVRPCAYGDFGTSRDNAKRVGDYLWRESGKLAQKVVPDGFAGVKWWDVWGMAPIEDEQEIGQGEFVQLRRIVRRKRDEVTGVKVKPRDPDGRLVPRSRERSLDGLRVTNLSDGMRFGAQLLEWAEEEVKRMKRIVIAEKGPRFAMAWSREEWTNDRGLVAVTVYGAACRSCGAALPFSVDGEVAARRFVREHGCVEGRGAASERLSA